MEFCAICGKKVGLNRFGIGKTESGNILWKCPACAKKGGYIKIVGEKAYLCDKEGTIIETPNYYKETRVLCNSCGHTYSFSQADIDDNKKIAKSAMWSSIGGIAGALSGAYAAGAINNASAEQKISQIKDYTKCPHCNSSDITFLSDEEWDELKEKKMKQETHQSTQDFSVADELKKFKELLDNGVISQEEFDAKKKQLLGI